MHNLTSNTANKRLFGLFIDEKVSFFCKRGGLNGPSKNEIGLRFPKTLCIITP